MRDTSFLLLLIITTSLWIENVFSQQPQSSSYQPDDPLTESDPILVTSDSCDWSGSGLDAAGSGRVIVPIYLRCLQGSIRWSHPNNGLRLLLSDPDHEFRGCIRIRRSGSHHHFSVPNVRVSVEEERGQSLRSLYHPADGLDADLSRCFSSRHKESVLFIEAMHLQQHQPVPYQKESVFELDYHLEPVASDKVLHNQMDECRPCTDSELVQSFCTSDFLVRGSISSLLQNELLSRTEIAVHIKSLIRDSGSHSLITNNNNKSHPHEKTDPQTVVLHRPLKCQSKSVIGSESDFLFMGRWQLGIPVIRCAPKWSEWKHVRHRSLQSGSTSCRL